MRYTAMVPLLRRLLGYSGENGVVALVIMLTDEMPADGSVELVEGAVRLAAGSLRPLLGGRFS